jgi:hypothetical protein
MVSEWATLAKAAFNLGSVSTFTALMKSLELEKTWKPSPVVFLGILG